MSIIEPADIGVFRSSRSSRVRRTGTTQHSRGVWLSTAALSTRDGSIDGGVSADALTALYWERDCVRAFAALAATKDPFLCGPAAAWWLTRGRVRLPSEVSIGVRSSRGKHLPGVHQLSVEDDELLVSDGVPCTSPARTASDVLRLAHRVRSVCAVDALTNRCLTTTSEIAVALERRARQRGMTRARTRLTEVEPNAGSAMETVLRLSLTDGGLPRPIAQLIMTGNDRSEFLGRADLGYEALKLAIEFLGLIHGETLTADWSRQNAASVHGWLAVGITSEHLRSPAKVVASVLDAGRRQHAVLGLPSPFALA